MSKTATKLAAGVAALTAFALGGAAIAGAGQGDEGDGAQLSGPTATKAFAAALKATGGGEVNQSERDGENGATYEVEVTKPDGSTVDVRLDAGFGVVVIEGDSEDGNGADGK